MYAHNTSVQTTVEPFDGLWHHVCTTWSNDGTTNVYLDVDQSTFSGTVSSGDLARGGCLTLGQLATESDSACVVFDPAYTYEGYLADVTFWAGTVTPAQVCLP